jgi:hypothetical protein
MTSIYFSKKVVPKKPVPKSLSLAVSSGVLMLASLAYATYTDTDTKRGGTITSQTSNSGNFNLTGENQSRAEFRYRSIKTGTVSLSGTMKIQAWNRASESGTDSDRISIIQALNIEEDNQPTGGSNPISQLTIRKSPTATDPNAMIFFVITGGSGSSGPCTGAPAPKEGSSYTISMTVAKGGSPTYKINGVSCTKVAADGDRAGQVGSDTGKFYYGKLGAYVTGGSSNPFGASGNGVTIRWSGIADY